MLCAPDPQAGWGAHPQAEAWDAHARAAAVQAPERAHQQLGQREVTGPQPHATGAACDTRDLT